MPRPPDALPDRTTIRLVKAMVWIRAIFRGLPASWQFSKITSSTNCLACSVSPEEATEAL